MTPTGVDLLPHLTRTAPRRTPSGLVLLLHGLVRSPGPLDVRSPSWLRMRLLHTQVRGALHRDGSAVWLLRYRFGGWSDGTQHPSPVVDARWALDRVREELGNLPVVLVGHSMGGRVAVTVADDPLVRGVVALAPWLSAADPVETLRGRHLLAAHGSRDQVTGALATRAYVARAAGAALSSEFVDMGPRGHTMLPGAAWNRVVVDGSRRFLAGT